jgi:hypothetical protein
MSNNVRQLNVGDADAFMALRLAGLASDPLAFSATCAEEVAAGKALAITRL